MLINHQKNLRRQIHNSSKFLRHFFHIYILLYEMIYTHKFQDFNGLAISMSSPPPHEDK